MNRNDQQYMVQKIRTQYLPTEHTALDSLKELDRKVKRPARIVAYIFGTISALVMGSGMSLVMTDIAETLSIPEPMPIGIAIGIIGMALVALTYPIYSTILKARCKKYAPQILAMSETLMQE